MCSSCKEIKVLSDFYKNSQRVSGHDHYCKDCRKKYIKEWARTPTGTVCRRRSRRAFYLANKDYELSKSRQWRRGVKDGSPPWLTESHFKAISNVYSQARDCSTVTGEPYEVDHIVPIRGEGICGLHVPWNLQVLPKYLNAAKSNKFNVCK